MTCGHDSLQMVHVSATWGRCCSVLLWPSLFHPPLKVLTFEYIYINTQDIDFNARHTHTYTVVVRWTVASHNRTIKYCLFHLEVGTVEEELAITISFV